MPRSKPSSRRSDPNKAAKHMFVYIPTDKFCLYLYVLGATFYIGSWFVLKAMDLFDVDDYFEASEVDVLSRIQCPVLVMGATTDMIFPIKQQRELADRLRNSGASALTFLCEALMIENESCNTFNLVNVCSRVQLFHHFRFISASVIRAADALPGTLCGECITKRAATAQC